MALQLNEAIMMIQKSEKQRAAVVTAIFKDMELKKNIQQYVINKGGSIDDALLIFDEMIIQFVKTAFGKTINDKEEELNPYLMGICKNLWFNELRKKNKKPTESLDDQIYQLKSEDEPASLFLNKERCNLLQDLLLKLRGNCKDVLMYWANGYSMVEIAEKLNYLSEGMARKKKSNCMKELLDYLHDHPHIKSQLI